MPSHLRPRPGTASAVGRLPIGRLVGSQCNFDQSSIVARMSSRAMQNGRSWVKKRNLGQKNETLAEKTGVSALSLGVSIERGGGIRKNFLGLANNPFAPHRRFSENRLAMQYQYEVVSMHRLSDMPDIDAMPMQARSRAPCRRWDTESLGLSCGHLV